MIKDNQKYFNRAHVLMDALITVISYSIAWVIRFIIVPDPTAGALGPEIYFSALFLVVPGYLLLNYMANMYSSKR